MTVQRQVLIHRYWPFRNTLAASMAHFFESGIAFAKIKANIGFSDPSEKGKK
jgi:hypothetical protein